MFFTILFTLLFLVDNKKNYFMKKKTDDNNEIEMFEVDNPLNQHNPVHFEDYWNKIHEELLVCSFKYVCVLLCVCIDVVYVNYVYL